MDIESIREYCIRKKAVTECFPFDEYNLVFKVVDRMFALINLENPDRIFLKCEPEYAIELRQIQRHRRSVSFQQETLEPGLCGK